ncbi:hypothetical protein [Moorena producens]|uniref:hypothetical protein n=1 Tax=Moorena producens TaxID=1155739 RepID=UPI003C72C378
MGETPKTALHRCKPRGNPLWRRCLPKTALPPQDRAASPRPRCTAAPCSLFPDPLFPLLYRVPY